MRDIKPKRAISLWLCRLSDAGLRLPGIEALGADGAIGPGCKLVSAWMEVTVDEGMGREEVLRLSGRLEPLHLYSAYISFVGTATANGGEVSVPGALRCC